MRNHGAADPDVFARRSPVDRSAPGLTPVKSLIRFAPHGIGSKMGCVFFLTDEALAKPRASRERCRCLRHSSPSQPFGRQALSAPDRSGGTGTYRWGHAPAPPEHPGIQDCRPRGHVRSCKSLRCVPVRQQPMNWTTFQNLFHGDNAARLLASARDYWTAGGSLMPLLAIIAFLIWQRYLVLFWRLRQALRNPDVCVTELDRSLRREDGAPPHSNLVSLDNLPGTVPRVAAGVLRRVANGLSFREAFSQFREAELNPFNHAFYVLGALVAAAPLLGLLGTVLGMIQTFDAVGARSADTAEMVARGISQALITTQVGLLAALPGTFGLAHLHRLYKGLANDLDRCESHLALVFEHGES